MGNEVAKLTMSGCRGAQLHGSVGVDINAVGNEGIPCAHNFAEAAADAAIYTNVDCIIDFSHHSVTEDLMAYCVKRGLPAVVCTTGQTEEEMACIRKAAESIPVFKSGNMSVGVAITAKVVKEIAAKFGACDIEIVETHHNRKVDAPSGTALMLADAVREARPELHYNLGRSGDCKREPDEIGINSVRMGNIVGIHEVMFGTNTQTITVTHQAHDRALFADGAVAAARLLEGKPAGMYNMDDLLAD
jgi:4-hydroxy-tetrahydrodipicolinate reductase